VEADKANIGPVALIDTDPQGSLSHWWNARAATSPHFAKVGLLQLSEALEELRKSGVKLAVVDTPPAVTDSISQVVAHADLVVIPTRPSPHDLRSVGATVDIAERHGKPLIFVMNGATARARITGETAIALSQHGTVAPITLHHRVDFAASMVDGRSVGEVMPKSQSAKEVRDHRSPSPSSSRAKNRHLRQSLRRLSASVGSWAKGERTSPHSAARNAARIPSGAALRIAISSRGAL
jgi:chromosome partitioning protein